MLLLVVLYEMGKLNLCGPLILLHRLFCTLKIRCYMFDLAAHFKSWLRHFFLRESHHDAFYFTLNKEISSNTS
jgi:hypothetical protein